MACLIGMGGYSILTVLVKNGIIQDSLGSSSLYTLIESAVAVGITSVFMTVTGYIHPPAASSALIAALGLMPDWHNVAILLLALGLISLQAWIMHRLNGVKFPLWAPFKETRGLKVETKLGQLNFPDEEDENRITTLAQALSTRQKLKK